MMKSLYSTEITLVFVLVCSLLCFGPTQQELTKGVSRTYVKEGEDTVLHCSSGNGQSLEKSVVHWKNTDDKDVFLYVLGHHTEDGWCCQDDQYKGRVSLFYDELKNGNASMILRDTRIKDMGNYTCILLRGSFIVQKSTMELIVGAVQEPFLGISKETESGVQLQCVVRGSSSKPSVEWQTCEGISLRATGQTVSMTRGRYDTTCFVIVGETETNCFRCMVTQEDIYHRIDREITVSGVSRTYVKEGEDTVLHCSSGNGQSLEKSVVHWKNTDDKDVFLYVLGHHTEDGWCCQDDQYKGRVSLFYDELKNGNASMILRDTRIKDMGNYTCILLRGSFIVQKSTMELIVGAVQEPFLGISKETESGVQLQCVVRGSSSKPSVEWQTCEGISLRATGQTVSMTRGRYDTTCFVIVGETETNCFRCMVTQEDIYHRIDREITVSGTLFEKKSSHSTGVLIGVWFSGVVTVVFLLALVLYLYFARCRGRHQNIHTKNMGNGTVKKEEEKINLMSSNNTSGPATSRTNQGRPPSPPQAPPLGPAPSTGKCHTLKICVTNEV